MQFLISRRHKKMGLSCEEGFTLIEIITVIVLLGIIGVMGSEVITTSFRGFAQTDASMELFEEGKLALMRMEREIHHMVPNAIDDPSGGSDITFGLIDVNTLTAAAPSITGQYQPVGASLNIRDLSNNALDGVLISIYNTSWSDFSIFPGALTNRKIYNTTAAGINMTLDKAVLGGHSASKRYYPVQKAIRYSLTGTVLNRSEAPVTTNTDFVNNFGTKYPLLSHIQARTLSFNYTPPSLTSNALVRVNFSLTRDEITLDFHKEIQVRNAP